MILYWCLALCFSISFLGCLDRQAFFNKYLHMHKLTSRWQCITRIKQQGKLPFIARVSDVRMELPSVLNYSSPAEEIFVFVVFTSPRLTYSIVYNVH